MKTKISTILKFFKYLYPYRKKGIFIFILTGLTIVLDLINPYLSKFIVDKGLINKDLKTFVILGLIGGGIFVLNGILKSTANFLDQSIILHLRFDLNKAVFRHLQRLPLNFFKNKSTAEHMFNLNYDIDNSINFIVSFPQELINIFPRTLFILAVIFYLDWQMAVFSLLLTQFLYLPAYYFTHKRNRLFEENIRLRENICKHQEEVFSHIYLIKALGKEKTEFRKYLKNLKANIKISMKDIKLDIVSSFTGESFHRLILGLITLFGGYQVVKGRITAGTFTAVMMYLTQLVGFQNSIVFFFQNISFGLISLKRLEEIFNHKPLVIGNINKNKAEFIKPVIEFRGVSFGYDTSDYVLKNINFKLEGRFIGLVGSSGCGKTTMLNLLLRLYEPWEGGVFIDGYNIKNISVLSLRNQMSVVLQESFLWNDTVENNIRYGRDNASRGEIEEAVKLVGIDDFIETLPKGYETIVGEQGCKFSEGQKQKIAIARALLMRPKILILDEAMSAMDSLSEERIITGIKKMQEISLVIVVSHRLSTVIASDLVCFIKKLGTVDIDKPEVLFKKNKEFYHLFAPQMIKINA